MRIFHDVSIVAFLCALTLAGCTSDDGMTAGNGSPPPNCEDDCNAADARRCDATGAVQICGDHDDDACLEWGDAMACQAESRCMDGFCTVVCESTCSLRGARRCMDGEPQICDDDGAGGCLVWKGAEACADGWVCRDGRCATTCSDDCTVPGARRCDGTGAVVTCGDGNGDGCLEWGSPTRCGPDQVCSNGFCAGDCQPECSVSGATRCDAGAVQTCEDSDGDGCLRWGSEAACDVGLSCVNGFCARECRDACDVRGDATCDGNGVKRCDDHDGDGCLDWGTVVPCAQGLTCSLGRCATGCEDECDVAGSRRCFGAAVQICGDVDADDCLEWGTADPCSAAATCADGFCTASCTDTCDVRGSAQCDGDGYRVCDDHDADGCLAWGATVACDSGQSCSQGRCSAECEDECEAGGLRRCIEGGVQICGQADGDPCLDWGTASPCDAGTTCAGGFCTADCSDGCELRGAATCDGEGRRICDDHNADGCLEWGEPVPCAAGQTCSGGRCAEGCEDDCAVAGSRRCFNDGVQICGNTDSDPCLDWGEATACANGAACAQGFCEAGCTDACDLRGAAVCEGDGRRICDDYDGDGCLEWGDRIGCGDGQTCSNGRCASDCEDECLFAGSRRCLGGGVQICGDSDADACLEWGAPADCAPGASCSEGFCVADCTNTCELRGLAICQGDGYRECDDHDADGCLEWGAQVDCEGEQTCSRGRCSTECEDECAAPGSRRCLGDAVQICGDTDADACLEWAAAVDCAPGETCSNGHCGVSCTDDCDVLGARRCEGDAVQICGDEDADGCLGWGVGLNCADGLTCADGFCATDCSDACTVAGARACDGDGYRVCGEHDGDGCLELGSVQPCAAGQTCSAGRCSETCVDECTSAGARRCQGDAVQICGDGDADPCLEWGAQTPCDAGLSCTSGQCELGCTDTCTVRGARQCANDGAFQICDDVDGDGCLSWGSDVSCELGLVCASGRCELDCSDACETVGLRRCDIAGVAVQRCDDHDADGCLEWGSNQACDPGLVCSGGHCAASCSDACGPQGATRCGADDLSVESCEDFNGDGCLQWGTPAPCAAEEHCVSGACSPLPPPGVLRINEVFYDADGADDDAFIELWAEPGLDLTGFVLAGVNGSNNQRYVEIPLSGAAEADGLFLIATSDGNAPLQDLADLLHEGADLQNGPDSLQVLWGGMVVDALAYGDPEFAAGEGAPAADVSAGHSLGRDDSSSDTDDNSADFRAFATPTPGAPNVDLSILPSAAIACPMVGRNRESLSFSGAGSSANGGSIARFAFDFGDGFFLAGPAADVSHVYAAPGSYEVVLEVTDDLGGRDTDRCTIAVADADAPIVTIVQPAGEVIAGQGATVTLVAEVTPAAGRAVTQTRLFVGGNPVGAVDSDVPYTHDYTVPLGALDGAIIALEVHATDDQGGVGVSRPLEVLVGNSPPVASFTAVASGGLRVAVDASSASDGETATSDLEVRWDWENDGVFDTNWSVTKTATHTYPSGGVKDIAMQVRDAGGASDQAIRSVDLGAVTDAFGTVSTSTWSGNVIVTGGVYVPPGETLTIAAGTNVAVLEFDQGSDGVGDLSITIGGRLLVQGEADHPVVFTTLDTDGEPNEVSWGSLYFNSTSGGSVIEHAIIEYARAGMVLEQEAIVRSTEVRFSHIGIVARGRNVELHDVRTHHNERYGVESDVRKFVSTGLHSHDNGWHGVSLTRLQHVAYEISDCTVERNHRHGIYVRDADAVISDCTIRDNGQVGVAYDRDGRGTLQRSNITGNGHEGISASISWGQTEPTPEIHHNNIHGNGLTGNLVFETVDLEASTTAEGVGEAISEVWSTPNGNPILFAEVIYVDAGNPGIEVPEVTGYLETGELEEELEVIEDRFNAGWLRVFTTQSDIRARVVDGSTVHPGRLTIRRVAYLGGPAGRELASIRNGTPLSVRDNYFGVWPNVPEAVTASEISDLDLDGFVGVPFDESFDTGIYKGGDIIEVDTTWDTDAFVTGDVEIAAGATLTIAAGTTVSFVPLLNGGAVDEAPTILRDGGHMRVAGTAEAPVLLTLEGETASNLGYHLDETDDGGQLTISHATLERGYAPIQLRVGHATLDDVTLRNNYHRAVDVTENGSLAATNLTVTEQDATAIELDTWGDVTLDRLTCTLNGGWCVRASQCTGDNRITHATIRNNAAGGVFLRNSHFEISQSDIALNGFGIRVEGLTTGPITANDIVDNDFEGVLVMDYADDGPSTTLTGNNIHGNAVSHAVTSSALGISAATQTAEIVTLLTETWTTPNDMPVLQARVSQTVHEPSGSGVYARLQSGGGNTLRWLTETAAARWHNTTSIRDNRDTSSIRVELTDTQADGSCSVMLHDAAYLAQSTSPRRTMELTVITNSGNLDATGNYWGTFPNVAGRMQNLGDGTVSFTGFRTGPIAGTGPQ